MEDNTKNPEYTGTARERVLAKALARKQDFEREQRQRLREAEGKLVSKQQGTRNALHEVIHGLREAPAPDMTMNFRSPEGKKEAVYVCNPVYRMALEDALIRYTSEYNTYRSKNPRAASKRALQMVIIQRLLDGELVGSEHFSQIADEAKKRMPIGSVMDDQTIRSEFDHMLNVCWSRMWLQEKNQAA